MTLLNYTDWFHELDGLLVANRQWWQLQTFQQRSFPWLGSAPALVAALEALDDAEVMALESDGEALTSWLQPHLHDAPRLLALARLPRLPQRSLSIPERLGCGVPGRKWAQVCAFVASRPASDRPALEWCAGKGHLGRLLASLELCPVTSLEWQSSLCRQGQLLAERSGVCQSYIQADVFAANGCKHLQPQGQALALHACGDLHTTLMRHWRDSCSHSLTLSPCCYHLIRTEAYVPLSVEAQSSSLHLGKSDLQLPLQETVTAGAGVRRRRDKELCWRLAFDELQRELRGVDTYLPIPNTQKQLFAQSFTDFARWAAERKGVELSSTLDECEWLRRGEERLRCVRRTELVTHLFRRPLEVWLALDRVLFLRAQGSRVSLGEFCARELTPRNIMIHAEK